MGVVLIFWALTTTNFAVIQGLFQEQMLRFIPYLKVELLFGLGPSLYLYTKCVANPKYELIKKDYLLFIPVVLELMYYRTPFYRDGAIQIGADVQNNLHLIFIVVQWSGFLYSTIFMVWSIILLVRYKKWLYNNFSHTQDKSLEWIQVPIVSFVSFWFVWFGIRLTDIFLFEGMYGEFYFFPLYIILTIIILWIGFKGYTNSGLGAIGLKTLVKPRKEISSEDNLNFQLIAESLKSKMDSEKFYLDPDLSLKSFATKTGIHENVISKVINQILGINFHEFVNRYRVKEFIERIKKDEKKQFTFLAHAYDSGFASKSSFNYIFKKQTQKTPREYFEEFVKK
ncbi:helix-turn-helix domain-containing protein [Xanthovirga aplysinae]|uniref:helix-turn-helix domain-containing protein n=1 Tax=Xanthovirga aplysinae TaxID=2529853 RepID=UPI00165729B5|nr:helix-turn-helix domain-containing protein [Xanthovirga aplysinae]